MHLCRFVSLPGAPQSTLNARVGMLVESEHVVDLSVAGWTSLGALLEREDRREVLEKLRGQTLPRLPLAQTRLLSPVELQEVWAVGVTYSRSKQARMEESDFSASAYDRVYDAERPELFFKALAEKVVGPGDPVGIRGDSRWSVPEPELALVLDSRGQVVGCTIGNDMSARDLEGENVLYLPQAKIYDRSCAVGPVVVVGAEEAAVRSWQVGLEIRRGLETVFRGKTELGRLKRSFAEMARYLFRSQTLPYGAVLLTGTGIVPPDDFTLVAGDVVRIQISGIGVLENPVVTV